MKPVLLTYGYHKSGHYSAVRALEEELDSRGVATETRNLWEGKTETIDRLFTIFRAFAAKSVKKVPDFLISSELFDLFAQEMPFDIDLHTYEGVISTHHYSTSLLAAHKQKQGCSVPLLHVHTDYTPFPLRTHHLIDFYTGATPRDDAEINIHNRVVATGIPVRKSFHYDGTPKEKRILILGGADGFGELEKITEFAAQLDPAYEPQIICGRNTEVYTRLKQRFSSHQVFGFVEDLSEHFNRAEFVITKASGLSVSEALNCECIPIFPPPIRIWEDDAARYLCAQGAGVCIPQLNATGVKLINGLLNSNDYKNALREQGRILAKPNAARDIVDLLEGRTPASTLSEQARMIEEMRKYYREFASANDLPQLAEYVAKQIEGWLRKYESNNRN